MSIPSFLCGCLRQWHCPYICARVRDETMRGSTLHVTGHSYKSEHKNGSTLMLLSVRTRRIVVKGQQTEKKDFFPAKKFSISRLCDNTQDSLAAYCIGQRFQLVPGRGVVFFQKPFPLRSSEWVRGSGGAWLVLCLKEARSQAQGQNTQETPANKTTTVSHGAATKCFL